MWKSLRQKHFLRKLTKKDLGNTGYKRWRKHEKSNRELTETSF